MNQRSGRSQRIHHNYTKIYLLTFALVLVTAIVTGLLILHFANLPAPGTNTDEKTGTETPEEPSTAPDDQTTEEPATTPDDQTTEEPQGGIERLQLSSSDFEKPNALMLINSDHPYTGRSLSGIVNVYNDRAEKHYSLGLLNSGISLNREALSALVTLDGELTREFPTFSLLVLSGYEIDLTKTACTAVDREHPNTDEHSSGYSFDVRYIVKAEDGSNIGVQLSDAAAVQQTNFLLKKAAELGFIQSKATLVGHTQNDLRHIRYVGVPHAQYIYENNLSLEDYLTMLKEYNFNKRLELSDAEGSVYELYFVKAAESGDTTVPVPKDADYSILSNNIDGYIVVVKL